MATSNEIKLILASASPARRRLLEMAGISAMVCPSNFDESSIKISNPAELVQTLARCKAEAVAQTLEKTQSTLILGCDSVLVLGGEIYGKPANKAEAIARWKTMRGQVGELLTGYALIDLAQQKILVRSLATIVHFALASDAEIIAYVETGEPLNCAGCFALEGKGGVFIEKLEGCHTNVIGLSLPFLRVLLQELGYNITHFWKEQKETEFYTHQGDPKID